MPTFTSLLLVAVAVLMTALAQILLKKASGFELRSASWVIWFGSSAVAYVVSFLLYSRILQYFALNKIYPAMTVAQIMVITVAGLWMGEVVSGRHALGLLFGIVSIYLILA